MAASHAVCYAMVLTNTISKKGGSLKRLRVTATVTGEKTDAGLKVVSSHLDAQVEGLHGLESASLQALATDAEKGCPISNAIRGSVMVTVTAKSI